MKIIKESIEEPIAEIELPQEEEQVEMALENNGIASLIIGAINNQWDSVAQFNDIIVNTDDDDIKNVINEVVQSLYSNIGALQGVLNKVTPHVENISQSEATTQEVIDNEI